MDGLVDEQIGQRRLTTTLLGAFAGIALLLAVIGIYGVIAYSVVQRTGEIGIRRALGAQHANVLRLVVGRGFGLALAGVVAGVLGAMGLTRMLGHLLFHVSATDPATFGGIALLFMVVALAASYIPASRATRIDPLAALRIE
jgi:ABC-type antimicrobial peptide transport system permease subunit